MSVYSFLPFSMVGQGVKWQAHAHFEKDVAEVQLVP